MAARNQITPSQLANQDPRRALGYGTTGIPGLIFVADLLPNGRIRLLRDSNVQNKFEFCNWISGTLTGFSGSAFQNAAVFPSGAYTIMAWVQGLASNYTQAYNSILTASFRRPASGDEVIVGASTKLFEGADVVGATSSIAGTTGGGVTINFTSNQAVLDYTWTFKAIIVSNVS